VTGLEKQMLWIHCNIISMIRFRTQIAKPQALHAGYGTDERKIHDKQQC